MDKSMRTISVGAALGVIVVLGVSGSAQKPAATAEQEWRTYNHDLGGTRF